MSCACLTPSWLEKVMLSIGAKDSELSNSTLSQSNTLEQHKNTTDIKFENDSELNPLSNQTTLVQGGFLYTADANNTVIADSWVLIKGSEIIAIGSSDDPIPEHDKLVDAKGKLLLPGLINPHWHESFVAPCHESADDSGIKPTAYSNGGDIAALGAMFGFISGVGQKLTLDEGIAIARWSMWTQLRSGTTALGDVGSANKADAMATAAIELGMRLRVSRWGSDIMLPDGTGNYKTIADTQEQTNDWVALIENWHEHSSGLVGAMPSVMGAFGSSDAQLLSLAEIAHKFNVPYATHLAPLKNERAAVEAVFGKSPIQRFDDMGLLTDRLLAVHTAYASEAEYQRLIATGVNICHSPAHYGMLGERTVSETGQLGRFLKDGVWVSTSTDGDISFIGGMCEAMRGAHLGHNEAQNCNTACPPTLALKTGSLFGAKALGWHDKIGSIEIGKQADLVLVNADDYRYKLGNHPLRTYLVTGSSHDVNSVMVAGEWLVKNGRSTRFDEAELFADYEKAVVSARARIGGPS
ncbi:amidohydrolase family protein [Pseudoalteromonas denitrificans]|uniref:Cytosine/adenosine deaminase n=1 Tax=Pseudoalteromonas denitrificans DSM 6059 TaxID=1123010 RepID=A0A1I1EPQ5_9GAMM|nr:amidohydrolase family protein [Pseudoalteromonas denitrificans]SFB87498.1 Cytosine/adenosine deaminase [Pseudoalteromonas denitrificans DSM 6059]